MSKFGGWDVLYREDISFMTGLISTKDLEDIQDAYNILFAIEFVLRAWAADFELKFWKNPLTLVDFAASVPPVLSFFELVSSRDPLLRFLRLLRVVRLLRLLDNRDPDSTLFGLVKSNSMGVQLAGIGFEFVCIFIITAGVVYDLEYATNPNVNNLNDTLYWAILTLTGIGQPFEVVTAGGRVSFYFISRIYTGNGLTFHVFCLTPIGGDGHGHRRRAGRGPGSARETRHRGWRPGHHRGVHAGRARELRRRRL